MHKYINCIFSSPQLIRAVLILKTYSYCTYNIIHSLLMDMLTVMGTGGSCDDQALNAADGRPALAS